MFITINDAPVICINHAAITYHVPATLILAIMKKENGRNGQAVRNKNGSYDLGILQINTRWLPVFARYGYTRDDLQFNPCRNIMAGTWILAQSIAKGKSVWQGIGDYHSHTPSLNKTYYVSIQKIHHKISENEKNIA